MSKRAFPNESTVLPFTKSFAGHETFPFRYQWLKKGVDLLNKDPQIFLRDDGGKSNNSQIIG
jgi:hypothetical protein